jgi:hypothetical protein
MEEMILCYAWMLLLFVFFCKKNEKKRKRNHGGCWEALAVEAVLHGDDERLMRGSQRLDVGLRGDAGERAFLAHHQVARAVALEMARVQIVPAGQMDSLDLLDVSFLPLSEPT